MTMRTSLLFCLLIGGGLAAQAQDNVPAEFRTTLRGNVRDAAGKALPFCTLTLLSARDSTLVKGGLANELGTYELAGIRAGRYVVAASMVGYTAARSIVFEVTAERTAVPTLTLSESTKALNEVTVVARKPLFEQQVDRLVVNVQNSITAAGGTALDVLERSPGITVNRQNGSMTMSGKAGVMVMLNGKLTRLPIATVMEMLAGMTASDIDKIELITTPPARYDAEGDAGLINIVTRKNTALGTNGSLSATMSYGWYERPSATLSLNHRNRKVNLYGSYSLARDHRWDQYSYTRQVQQTTGALQSDIVSNRYSIRHTNTARLGIEYTLSPQTTLNGLVAGFSNDWSGNLPTLTLLQRGDVPVGETTVAATRRNRWEHLLLNMNLRHVFKNKQEWSLDIDRLYYNNHNPSDYLTTNYAIQEGKTDRQQLRFSKETPIQMWVLKTDFQLPVGQKGRLETGVKATMSRLSNDVALDQLVNNRWQVDTMFTQRYTLAEDILAGYVSLNQPLAAQTTLQAGLRYEHTQTDINTVEGQVLVHRRYGNWFPSLFLSRKLSKNHSVNLSYSRRITRPTYDDIAPLVLFIDPNTYASGNPALLPTISDAVQGSYTFKDAYVFSVRYSDDQHAIAGIQPHVDAATNRISYYAENLAQQQTLSANVSLPVQITRWWQSQTNMTLLHQLIVSTYQTVPVSQRVSFFRANTTFTFKLPRQFTAELTGFYTGPSVNGLYRFSARNQVIIGLQKVLPAGRGTFRMSLTDIFWGNITRIQSAIAGLNFSDRAAFVSEPRVWQLTYNRSFGSKTVKAANTRVTGSDEERKRLIN